MTTSANDVRTFIKQNEEAKTLVFEIASYGGFVTEGFEMYDVIRNSGKKIITIGYRVNSIAVIPFLAGDKRYVSENCDFVIHNARIDPMNLGINPLTAEDLAELFKGVQQTDNKILDAYCDVLGEEKRTKLLALMGAEANLGASGAIKLGFAHGYWKLKEKVEKKNITGPAMCIDEFWNDRKDILITIQNKFMENEKVKEIQNKMGLLEKAFNFFRKRYIKNEVTLTLTDGVSLFVDAAEGEDLVGKPAFILTDGVPGEPAPDGEHALNDGRTIVVAAGIITEVREGEEMAKLKEENATLKKSLEEKDAATAAAQAENKKLLDSFEAHKSESQKALKEIENKFEEFKKLVPGDGDDKKKEDHKEQNNVRKLNPEVARIYAAQQNRFKK